MFFFQEGFTYRNFFMDVLTIFVFIMWFWLLISVAGDLFRRHDISGWGKAIWIIVLILIPYIGVFAYLISQGRGMAERNTQQAQQAREELRRVVGFSAADEIEKLDRLKKAGIDQRCRRICTSSHPARSVATALRPVRLPGVCGEPPLQEARLAGMASTSGALIVSPKRSLLRGVGYPTASRQLLRVRGTGYRVFCIITEGKNVGDRQAQRRLIGRKRSTGRLFRS